MELPWWRYRCVTERVDVLLGKDFSTSEIYDWIVAAGFAPTRERFGKQMRYYRRRELDEIGSVAAHLDLPALPERQVPAPNGQGPGDSRPDGPKLVQEELRQRRFREVQEEARVLRAIAADRQELIEAIRADVERDPVLHIPRPTTPRKERSLRTLMPVISDAHFGQLFARDESGGLNDYNIDVAAERIDRMTKKILAITDDLRAGGRVDRICPLLLGDLVDGRDVHPGHDWQSVPMAVQLRRGSAVMAELFFAPLAGHFDEVDTRVIIGNHGRIGKKGQLHMVLDNHDLIFADYLKFRCEKMGNVRWAIEDTWYTWFTLHGHAFFGAHGDSFKAWNQIPFYGAQRYLGNVQAMLHKPVDAMIVGHHHNAAHFPVGWSNIVMNGSVVGTGRYGSWLGYSGPPLQKLLLVSDDFPVATQYDLILATRQEMLTTEPDNLDEPSA